MSTIVKAETPTNVKAQHALDALRQRHSDTRAADKALREVTLAAGIAKVWVARAAHVALRESGLSQSALSRETGIPRATLVGYIDDARYGLHGGKWSKGKDGGKPVFTPNIEPLHDPYSQAEPTTAEVEAVAAERHRRGEADRKAKAEKARLAEEGRKATEGEVSDEAEPAAERSTPQGEDEDALTYSGAEALMTRLIAQLSILEKTGPQTEADEIARGNVLQMLQTAVSGLDG